MGATAEIEKLIEQVRERNQTAIEEGEETVDKLDKAIEESDRRVGPAVKKLKDAGLIDGKK